MKFISLFFLSSLIFTNFTFANPGDGYDACYNVTFNAAQCASADAGFQDCYNVKFVAAQCISARAGFKDCYNTFFKANSCLKASAGFKDCIEVAPMSAKCINAIPSFKSCYSNTFNVDTCAPGEAPTLSLDVTTNSPTVSTPDIKPATQKDEKVMTYKGSKKSHAESLQ